MSVNRYYSNTAVDTALTADVSSGATTIAVGATTGFPLSYPFTLVLDPGEATQELVEVTSVSTLTLTVTRGVDDTTAQSHTTGAVVQHDVSARDYREPQEHIAATTGVHGVGTGDVVGTDATQTLTNKTLTGGTISGGKISSTTEFVDSGGSNLAAAVDVGNFIAAITRGGWRAWNPTVTTSTGVAPTFDTGGFGGYHQIGDLLFLKWTGLMTAAGSGGGSIRLPLPVNSLSEQYQARDSDSFPVARQPGTVGAKGGALSGTVGANLAYIEFSDGDSAVTNAYLSVDDTLIINACISNKNVTTKFD